MEDSSPDDAPAVPQLAYTTAALARSELSAQLAELAAFMLLTADDCEDPSRIRGSYAEDLIQIVHYAEMALDAAVVAEREAGTTWTVLGERFETTASAVQRRFDTAIREWTRVRDGRTAPGGPPSTVAIREELTATNIKRFNEAVAAIYNDRPPRLDHLPRYSPTSLLQALADDEAALAQAYAIPDPRRIADIAERRATVYEHLAHQSRHDGKPDDATEHDARANMERQRATAYRAQPAGAVPYQPAEPTP